VHLPYVADENADEDPEIKISIAAEGPAFSKMREIMVSKGRKVRAAGVQRFRASPTVPRRRSLCRDPEKWIQASLGSSLRFLCRSSVSSALVGERHLSSQTAFL
jgi:hypothetical protein